eukprot:TRINITY_DN25862_c0_g1_i1.p1 TRINITY_DN25862_c0_g1~~TRINITY_DN25862_c0_g1_i1.p1  ORF type:complete len:191 (+),score=29.57 TRINITY_DN25862_c0_g1_i1:27-575(+)
MRQNEASHMADLHNDGRVGLHRTIAQAHHGYCQLIQKELMMKPSAYTRRLARRLAAGEKISAEIVEPCEGVARCMQMIDAQPHANSHFGSSVYNYVVQNSTSTPTPTPAPPTVPQSSKRATRPLPKSHLPTAPPFAVLSDVFGPPTPSSFQRKRPHMSFFMPLEERIVPPVAPLSLPGLGYQ